MNAPAQRPNHDQPGHDQPGHDQPSRTYLARLALALYPPSWRDRYADEVRVLLDDSGAGPAAIASLAWRALPAWMGPSAQLGDRPARIRSHLSTGLMAWSMLTGLGLVFAQLTELQSYRLAGHPLIGWSYAVFDVALLVSALTAGLGGLPLWLLMLRQARRDMRPGVIVCLLAPILAPAAWLAGAIMVSRLFGGPGGVSVAWFAVVAAAGFVLATAAATGPVLAMRGLRPRGPALHLAAKAGGVAAALMAVAAVAILVALTGLVLWVPGFPGHHHPAWPGVFLVLAAVAATVTVVSGTRGARAAHTQR